MISMSDQSRVLIMAGGTGGHIFPGLAVARAMEQRGWQLGWLGSKGGMEETLVGKEKIDLNLISISGLRGNGILGWLKAPFSLTQAVFEAVKVLRNYKPQVVIGFGGFASGPGGIAAFITGTPLVIHEQNAVAGMTNKVLAKLAKKVFQAFPGAFKSAKKVTTIGNPIRNEIESLHSKNDEKVAEPKTIKILVVGGSRGALALNKNVPLILSELLSSGAIKLRHQVGKGRVEETQSFYREIGINSMEEIDISEFIDDMAEAFNWADLVICRAGASTVSEVAAVGVCAVFVPYPYAVDDHQTANANWLVKEDAAICIAESKLADEASLAKVKELIGSPQEINQMAQKAKKVAYLNAATKVAEYCDALRKKAA